MSEQQTCFMCDPSILEQGQRCATGAPICDRHRDQLTGNMRPPTAAESALTARAEAAEQQAAEQQAARLRAENEALNAGWAWESHWRRCYWCRGAEAYRGTHYTCTEGVARQAAALGAGWLAAAAEMLCRCNRPLINPGDKDPWCEGCTMSAVTCDCVSARV